MKEHSSVPFFVAPQSRKHLAESSLSIYPAKDWIQLLFFWLHPFHVCIMAPLRRPCQSEKSDRKVGKVGCPGFTIYRADRQHDCYCSMSFGRCYSIVCLGYRHKASRKSRIVKSEKSDLCLIGIFLSEQYHITR